MQIKDWDKYFPHFAPEEYLSPVGMHIFKTKNVIPFDTEIVHSLEFLRRELNKKRDQGYVDAEEEIQLVINTKGNNLRGFVTPEEWINLRTKRRDQLFSFHLWCAADVSSPQVTPEILFKFAKDALFNGVIRYSWGVHLDLRRGSRYIEENLTTNILKFKSGDL